MKGNVKDNVLEHIYKNNRPMRLFKIFLGSFIVAIIYYSFVVPNEMVFGGLSGLAIPFNEYFHISLSIFINVANVFLIILSLILIGYKKTRYTVLGYIVYGFMISVCAPLAKYFVINFDSKLFSTIFNAIIYGFGAGLIYSTGFNTAGTDAIVHIIQNYIHIPTGKITAIVNSVIIIIGASLFGIINSLYAIIFLIISNIVTDFVLIGKFTHRICYISTSNMDEVSKYISNDLNLDYTILDNYKKKSILHRPLLLVVIHNNYYYELEEEILKIDKTATISSSYCYSFDGGRRIKYFSFNR